MELWDFLRSISSNSPWLIQGDYNCILSSDEKSGGSALDIDVVSDFRSCLDDVGLLEVRRMGCRFSWTNNQMDDRRIWYLLDRALFNSEGFHCFSHSTASLYSSGISDHSPLLVDLNPDVHSKPKPFRYFDF